MFVRTIFLLGFFVVAGALVFGALVSGDDAPSAATSPQPPASAIDEAPTSTVEPVREAVAPTATTQPLARATPATAPTERPEPTSIAPTSTPEPANVTGVWNVLYTITSGNGAGQSYSFDVTLEQNGGRISGGNDGIRVDGTAEGRTVTLTYRQPALGYTATFTWTLVNGSWGGGAFRSAVNAGTSLLQRVR